MPETVCGGEPLRCLLGSAERQHCRDAEAGEVGFATLEERSPQAGFTGLQRDTDLQEAGALGALILDCRRRPADELAVFLGGPVAAVRVRWLRLGRMLQTPLRSDPVRPDAVQQLRRCSEVLSPALTYQDSKHRQAAPKPIPKQELARARRALRGTFPQHSPRREGYQRSPPVRT